VRTLDSDRGIIEVLIAPDMEKDFNQIIQSLSPEIELKEISKPEELASIED